MRIASFATLWRHKNVLDKCEELCTKIICASSYLLQQHVFEPTLVSDHLLLHNLR